MTRIWVAIKGGLYTPPTYSSQSNWNSQNLWVITGYGLLRVWVMTGLTVYRIVMYRVAMNFMLGITRICLDSPTRSPVELSYNFSIYLGLNPSLQKTSKTHMPNLYTTEACLL